MEAPAMLVTNDEKLYKDYDKFIKLREAYKKGNVQSRDEIVRLARNGSGISIIYVADGLRTSSLFDKDLEKARGWYDFAARGGLPHGQNGLGLICKIRGDYADAIKHFSDAVSQDFAPAMNQLGWLYYTGKGIERDPLKARELWSRGARLGNIWSKKHLAHSSISGIYGPLEIFRGLFLLISGAIELPFIVVKDNYSERLR